MGWTKISKNGGIGGLTPEQSQAIDDYINPDYTRLTFDGPQVINTTASTVQLGTELEGSGIVYDPLDESITFPGYDRIYVFNLSINGTSAGNNNAFCGLNRSMSLTGYRLRRLDRSCHSGITMRTRPVS